VPEFPSLLTLMLLTGLLSLRIITIKRKRQLRLQK
jgi:hypothetical protein